MAPKKVDKDARRRDILSAAALVFAKYGYQRATIDQISEAAGIAKGSIYLTFASKEDLFYALFEDFVHNMLVDVQVDDSHNHLRPSAKFECAICSIAEAIDANESIFILTLEFWSICGVEATRERFGRRYAELFHEFRSYLVDLLKEAQKSGEIADGLPLESIASCFMAMIDGLLIQQWTGPGIRASTTLKQALPVFFQSLRGKNHD